MRTHRVSALSEEASDQSITVLQRRHGALAPILPVKLTGAAML